MILFCEDCGKRNTIDSDDITIVSGFAQFRCNECKYLSRVVVPDSVSGTEQDASSKKKAQDLFHGKVEVIIEKLVVCGGAGCSFVFHTKRGVVVQKCTDETQKENLEAVGRIFLENYLSGQNVFKDITGGSFFLKHTVMLCRKVTGNVLLVLICPQISGLGRIDELLDLAVDELRAVLIQ